MPATDDPTDQILADRWRAYVAVVAAESPETCVEAVWHLLLTWNCVDATPHPTPWQRERLEFWGMVYGDMDALTHAPAPGLALEQLRARLEGMMADEVDEAELCDMLEQRWREYQAILFATDTPATMMGRLDHLLMTWEDADAAGSQSAFQDHHRTNQRSVVALGRATLAAALTRNRDAHAVVENHRAHYTLWVQPTLTERQPSDADTAD